MYLNTSTITPDDAIASVLGKTRSASEIVAALDRTFLVSADPVTGKSEVTFVPAGSAALTTSGGRPRPLRGSHASLFERASAVIKVMRPIVIRIEPATADGDCSEVEAVRGLIPPTLDAIADAMGSSEQPVRGVVDGLLGSLEKQTTKFGTLLGIDRGVNTPCDETRWTDFKILTESQQTLNAIWTAWKSTTFKADLGVTMADVEAEMNEIADATDELRDALLAAGIVPADWSSLDVSDGVNLAQFFDCVGSTPGRAQLAVRDGGRHGLTLSVEPMLTALRPLAANGIISKGGCVSSTPEVTTAFCRIRTAIDTAINAITNLGGQP
jgi:hypothetical protein